MIQRNSHVLAPRGLLAPALIALLAADARARQVCFEDYTPFAVGTRPSAVAVGDVDQDGVPDVVAANEGLGTSTLSVLIGLGDGTFAAQVGYPVGARPVDVVLGDIDGDGDLDAMTADQDAEQVTLLFNVGGGVFAPAGTLGLPSQPTALATGDLDGDGDLDLVVAWHSTGLPSSGFVHVYPNDGTGLFGAPTVLTQVNGIYQDVVIGDLNGDGALDLLVGSSFSGLRLYLNQGGGAFGPVSTTSIGFNPMNPALGDVDADGDLDVAFSGPDGGGAYVYANDGAGMLSSLAFVTSPNAFQTELADLDGDGVLDLAFVTGTNGTLSIARGLGAGTFATPDAFPFATSSTFSGSAIRAADLDADGDLDWVGANRTTHQVRVLRNCTTSGTPFCAGDGSGTACPCGNDSTTGSGDGCLHSFGLAGRLRGVGSARLANDQLVLLGSQMPSGSALYFQGTAEIAGGAGSTFGDGLRCAGGSVLRLKSVQNVGGTSQFPAPGDPTVSAAGAVVSPGVRVYQIWYRNAASFCTASAFNLTNGIRVTWAP